MKVLIKNDQILDKRYGNSHDFDTQLALPVCVQGDEHRFSNDSDGIDIKVWKMVTETERGNLGSEQWICT